MVFPDMMFNFLHVPPSRVLQLWLFPVIPIFIHSRSSSLPITKPFSPLPDRSPRIFLNGCFFFPFHGGHTFLHWTLVFIYPSLPDNIPPKYFCGPFPSIFDPHALASALPSSSVVDFSPSARPFFFFMDTRETPFFPLCLLLFWCDLWYTRWTFWSDHTIPFLLFVP